MSLGHAYYNENDPFAAAWLRELIAGGFLPAGDVDQRSILDVRPGDLVGYRACHFFAGIGGWPLAAEIAGWPRDREIWTGSCPCQPLSLAGDRRGHLDERHLWPAFQRLIAERRPATAFGEQVAGPDGREWVAAVRLDLEQLGYACGAADLPAAGVRAPHQRPRIWWVADAAGGGWGVDSPELQAPPGGPSRYLDVCGRTGGLADSDRAGLVVERGGRLRDAGSAFGHDLDGRGALLGLAEPAGARPQGLDGLVDRDEFEAAQRGSEIGGLVDAALYRARARFRPFDSIDDQRRAISGGPSPWDYVEWLACRDGTFRPTRPGLFPLADGLSNRVGMLRGAGNAIVPLEGALFIDAFLAC